MKYHLLKDHVLTIRFLFPRVWQFDFHEMCLSTATWRHKMPPQNHKCSFCNARGHNCRQCPCPGAAKLRVLLAKEKERTGTLSKNEGRAKVRAGGTLTGHEAKKKRRTDYTGKARVRKPEHGLLGKVSAKSKENLATPNPSAAKAAWAHLKSLGFLKKPRKCQVCRKGVYGSALYCVKPRVRKGQKSQGKRASLSCHWVFRCKNWQCQHRLNAVACGGPWNRSWARAFTLEQMSSLLTKWLCLGSRRECFCFRCLGRRKRKITANLWAFTKSV